MRVFLNMTTSDAVFCGQLERQSETVQLFFKAKFSQLKAINVAIFKREIKENEYILALCY